MVLNMIIQYTDYTYTVIARPHVLLVHADMRIHWTFVNQDLLINPMHS